MQRWMLASVVACLTVFAAVGCSGDNGGGAGKDQASGGSAAQSELPMKDGKYDPPVTITTVKGITPAIKFRTGENIDNNVMTKWAKERLGIEVKYLWSVTDTNNAFETKMRLALSSNEPMPDVIYTGSNQLMQDLIDSGKFQEVGSLFDKYASETWKKAMQMDETVWYPVMRDGKKYGIPNLEYIGNNDSIVWVREDWRKKLNLPEPKTLEDLEKMMDAFKNQNPDGLKDVTPLTIGFQTSFTNANSDTGPIFGAFGTMPGQWNLNGNGELEYGSITPGAKAALAKLAEWIQKGYIHKESALWNSNKANELFVAGKSGITMGAGWMPWTPFPDLYKNVPGAEVKAYQVPLGPDGKAGKKATNNVQGFMLVNKDMKNPEILFTYQNYLMDHYGAHQQGSEFEFGLAKGYDWDVIDGKVTKDQTKIKDFTEVQHYALFGNGARVSDYYINMRKTVNDKLAKGAALTDMEKIEHEFFPKEGWAAYYINDTTPKSMIYPQMFTGAPTKSMKTKNEFLKKLEMDTFSKIIYGNAPITAFDEFVKAWKSSGGDDITKEVNDWYKSVKAK
jgi:putative aldouronate transport system substrate-binding protein